MVPEVLQQGMGLGQGGQGDRGQWRRDQGGPATVDESVSDLEGVQSGAWALL
jgi:hypothetical protein